jgi:hypothetical protein
VTALRGESFLWNTTPVAGPPRRRSVAPLQPVPLALGECAQRMGDRRSFDRTVLGIEICERDGAAGASMSAGAGRENTAPARGALAITYWRCYT